MRKHTNHTIRKRILFIILGIVLVIVGKLVLDAARFAPALYGLAFKKEIELKKTDERVNILILGIGGGKHDGPNLTDTIIFANLDPKKKKVSLVSIPRDLWVPDLKAKINAAYAYGENRQKGGGIVLTKAVVSKILGQRIDYVVRIDFAGFVKAVDIIGGLDVNVERTFDDLEYPVSGKEQDTCGFEGEEFEKRATMSAAEQKDAFPCRYEHLHFDAGEQHMDGETALRYVRSRHATGLEGTDFARSQRQEKVIKAFRDKVLSAGTLLNPVKAVNVYATLQNSVDTDIKEEEFDDFIKLARKLEGSAIQSIVLDAGNDEEGRLGLLKEPDYAGSPSADFGYQWVLLPRAGNGDFREIQRHISCVIIQGECEVTPQPIE